MEAGLGGQGAAGRLRAADTDREQAVALLQAAFAEGRLTREEFGERVGGALTARTYADLAAVTADIPAGIPAGAVAAPQRAAGPARSRHRPGRRAVTGTWTLVLGAVMMTDAALTGSAAGPAANLFYVLFIMAFLVAFVSWLCAISAHRGDAASGQPPAPDRPSVAAGQAAACAGQPAKDSQDGDGTAQATRGHPARRLSPEPRPLVDWRRVGLASH